MAGREERSAPKRETDGSGRMLLVLPQPFFEDRGTSIAIAHVLRAVSELGYRTDILSFPPGRQIDIRGVSYLELPNPFGFRRIPIGFSVKKVLLDLFLFAKTRRQLDLESYLCVHAVEEAGYLAAFLRRRRDVFVIYDMQSSLPEQLAQYRRFRSRAFLGLLARLERRTLRGVDLVVCSAGLESHARTVAPDTPVLTWRFPATLPRPTEDEVARLRSALGLPADAKVVLYAGSFARYQGLDVLIGAAPYALERVPDALFLLVGAGDDGQLTALARSIPDELAGRVLLKRRVPREQVPAFLGLADVLISPRSHGGNLPLKALEYLDSGKPIVASDIPTHRVLFRNGTALLAEPDSPSFGEAIARVLTDEALATQLTSAGTAYAEQNLAWARFVELVEQIMERAQGSGGARAEAG